MSAIFILGGYGKMTAAAATTAYFAKDGLPMPEAAYALAVFIEFFGGLALLLGFLTTPTAIVIGVWCVATALVAHTNFADLNMKIHFMKNMAMAGGCAYIAAFGGGAYSADRLRALRHAAIAA